MHYAALDDVPPHFRSWLESVGLFGLTQLAVIVTLAVVVAYGVFDYIDKFAAADAEKAKLEAPAAILMFSHPVSVITPGLAEAGQSTFGPVRVIMENDDFIYVTPVSTTDLDPPSRVIAFPTRDIQSVRYLSDDSQ